MLSIHDNGCAEVGICSVDKSDCTLQARLGPGREDAIRKAVPGLTDKHISLMKRCPMRTFDQDLLKEPHIYRLHEVLPGLSAICWRCYLEADRYLCHMSCA